MLTKLSPRNLFLVVLAACLITAALWYTMRFQTRQAEITALNSELETVRSRVTVMRSHAQALPALREEVTKLKVQQDEFLAALPPTANYYSILDEIRLNAAAAGAEMTSFSVGNATAPTTLPAGVRPIALNVNVSGRFAQLFQLLRSVETMSRFSNVNNVSLQLPQAVSRDPVLEGTLALTVYTFDPNQASSAAAGTTPQAPAAAPAAPAPTGGTQ
ncbi:type 4a pilus biogenesis protein PilO [Deinococcus taeanensis]|uniref:type 4a pilus biogenesis protein PilO n=1 Tax=Deinococcus taeanensis TaxID=2737050 RepID=UPI001CDD5838|nr:type 4a pilus biogenesis protein PilO [Deinococcus taeanensis]UBV41816.1 type 4a pilus biogenesis protein PilO [Deinococcus taeanensis]